MDALKAIEKLVFKARSEQIPGFDVSGRVLAQIKYRESEIISFLPFDLFAGISVAAASIVAFFSVNVWHYITNPIINLFAPFMEIPLW